MRHLHAGDKLGVLPDHRRALLRNLTLALMEHGEIVTTPRRAKAMRWHAEHIVTLAKRGDLSARRQIHRLLGSTETAVAGQNRIRLAVEKLYEDLAPRFKSRPGGYTQIFRLAKRRRGDNAELCLIRYIPAPEEKGAKDKGKSSDKSKKKTAGDHDKKVSAKAAPQDKAATKKAAPAKAEAPEDVDSKKSKAGKSKKEK